MNEKIFFEDVYKAERNEELEHIGECTISLCYRPGIIAFGLWVMCREHALQYLEFRKEKNAGKNRLPVH